MYNWLFSKKMVFFNLQLFLTSWWTLFYIDYVSHVRIILPCNGQNLLEEVRQKTDDLVEQSEPVGEVWGPTWPRWPSGPCSRMRSGPRRRGKSSGKNINFSFLSYNRQKVDKWQLFFSSFTLIVVSWRMSKVLT